MWNHSFEFMTHECFEWFWFIFDSCCRHQWTYFFYLHFFEFADIVSFAAAVTSSNYTSCLLNKHKVAYHPAFSKFECFSWKKNRNFNPILNAGKSRRMYLSPGRKNCVRKNIYSQLKPFFINFNFLGKNMLYEFWILGAIVFEIYPIKSYKSGGDLYTNFHSIKLFCFNFSNENREKGWFNLHVNVC